MANSEAALTGAALESLLDRLEADLQEAPSAQEMNLLGRLRARPLRADTLAAVDRLHRLWIQAGDSAAALAAIDKDGAQVVADAPEAERANIRMWLEILRAQVGSFLNDETLTSQALTAMRAIVDGPVPIKFERFIDLAVLMNLPERMPEVALDTIELRHALALKIPGRDTFRCRDEVARQSRRTLALQRLGQAEEARAAAEKAVAAIEGADQDQVIDDGDWLWLGYDIIESAPHLLPNIRNGVVPLITGRSPPRWREGEIRLARLTARARHATGDLAGALALCGTAHFALQDSTRDNFIEYELPWLIEAKRFDEAGRLVFSEIYEKEGDVAGLVIDTLHAQLADPGQSSFWWPLCIMRACGHLPTLEHLCGLPHTSPETIRERSPLHAEIFAALGKLEDQALLTAVGDAAGKIARERAPDAPWLERVAAAHDHRAGRIDDAALIERIEAAARRADDVMDWRTANVLFGARVEHLGLAAAVAPPTPELVSGASCYNLSGYVAGHVHERLDQLPDAEQSKIKADLSRLSRELYEQGLRRMETCHATGKGHPYDAEPHNYSMLCCDLAATYRHEEEYQRAIDLHWKGIATSPFAEHYDGIFLSRHLMGDDAATVEASEALWQFATRYGYSRHDANFQAGQTAEALRRLSRPQEIPLWLDRLVTWQREVAGEDEQNLGKLALIGRIWVAKQLRHEYPDMALSILTGLMPQIDMHDDREVVLQAADLAYFMGQYQKGIEYYERVKTLESDYKYDAAIVENIIAECKQALALATKAGAGGTKPWWKVWG
jgi:tetratricopeptide (TPR) repeat protein